MTFIDTIAKKPPQALTAIVDEIEVYLPLGGIIDLEQEISRLEKELQGVEKDLKKVVAKLSNDNFLKKAPGNIIEKEKNKHDELDSKRKKLTTRMTELKKLL